VAKAEFSGWISATPAPETGSGENPPPLADRAFTYLKRATIRLQGRADRWVAADQIWRAKLLELTRVALYVMAAMGWPCYRVARTLERLVAERWRRSRLYRVVVGRVPAARNKLRALGYKPTFSELIDELLSPRRRIPQLHTVACGDFMLTDIDSWHRIRGTPELSIYSMYLDALAMITAYKVGVTIEDLPSDWVIYHIDHQSGWTPGQQQVLYRRMNEKRVPILSYATYLRYAVDLLEDDAYFLASPQWGLAEEELPEQTMTRRMAGPSGAASTHPSAHGVGGR
jgi:hypothetical protein